MKQLIYFLLITIFAGCAIVGNKEKLQPFYSFQAGLNKGGITENTDFKKTPNIQPDAFSGATKTGYNAGIHIVMPLIKNSIESGIDYMYNNQIFNYNDIANNYVGKREFHVSQLMIPLTYNIGLFRKIQPYGLFRIKFGGVIQGNIFSVKNYSNTLTNYSLKKYSAGLTFGISAIPIKLKNGACLGFYFDGYRGTKVYDDFYNNSIYEMPATSYLKFGIIYQFKISNK